MPKIPIKGSTKHTSRGATERAPETINGLASSPLYRGKAYPEPVEGPPIDIFVDASTEAVEEALREAKRTSDKAARLLRDLGVVDE